MKLGAATKLDKRNTKTSKKLDDDVTLPNFDVIVFFNLWPIWSNPDVGFWIPGLQYLHFH